MIKKLVAYITPLIRSHLVQNMLTVGGITLILKLIGFFKETLVAATFGLSEVLDTFFIAFLVPSFISNVFLGAFKAVFIPNYIAEEKTAGDIASFQGMGFTITAMISVVFMLAAYLITDVYVELLFPGHDAAYYALIHSQFIYLFPCIIIWGFSSLLGGLLYINNEYRYSSFYGAFIPISIIFFLFFLIDAIGPQVLAVGTFVGSVLGFLYLLALCVFRGILKLGLPDFKNSNAITMFKQVPAKISSGIATGLNPVVDQFFAAQLVVGSIASLNYGIKIPAFISGLVIISISGVLLPYFSKSIHDNKKKTFDNLFRIMRLIFFGSIAVVIFAFIFSEPLIRLLFERKEFTAENTMMVTILQQAFLVYLPFAIVGMIMVNFLTSINKNAIMAYVAIGALVLNIILDYILMQYYGVLGIAICTTVVIILKNLVIFWYIVRLRKKNNEEEQPPAEIKVP